MTIQCPRAVEACFDADRPFRAGAIAAEFSEYGIVQGKGMTHKRRYAIRKWIAEVLREYSYTCEPVFIATKNRATQGPDKVIGAFPGRSIDLRFFVAIAGDKAAELEVML